MIISVKGTILRFLLLFPALTAMAGEKEPTRSVEYQLSIERWNNRLGNPYKIIGGHEANYANYKWEVALLNATIPDNYYAQFCGASYIAKSWVVTAAHCVAGLDPSDMKIMYGSARLDESGKREAIDSIVRCNDCAGQGSATDIALLKLHDVLSVHPIEMVPKDKAEAFLQPGTVVIISGWGLLDPSRNDSRSITLRETSVKFQTLDDCNGPEGYDGAISKASFCAGYPDGATDACTGDSGGPALIEIDGARKLAGIVSKGDGCGKPKKYGVYVRAFDVEKWIESNAK